MLPGVELARRRRTSHHHYGDPSLRHHRTFESSRTIGDSNLKARRKLEEKLGGQRYSSRLPSSLHQQQEEVEVELEASSAMGETALRARRKLEETLGLRPHRSDSRSVLNQGLCCLKLSS